MTLKQPSQILSTAKIRAKKKISETIGVCLFGCYQAIDTEFISMDDTWAVHSVRMESEELDSPRLNVRYMRTWKVKNWIQPREDPLVSTRALLGWVRYGW